MSTGATTLVRSLRFTLPGLLAAILVIALGCAALASGSELWADVALTVAVLACLAAMLGTVFGTSCIRAYCAGFLLAGLAYLLLVRLPWTQDTIGKHLLSTKLLRYLHEHHAATLPPRLDAPPVISLNLWVRRNGTYWFNGEEIAEEDLLNHLRSVNEKVVAERHVYPALGIYPDPTVSADHIQRVFDIASAAGIRSAGRSSLSLSPKWEDFERVGQSLFSLVLGAVGGAVARWFYERRRRAGINQAEKH